MHDRMYGHSEAHDVRGTSALRRPERSVDQTGMSTKLCESGAGRGMFSGHSFRAGRNEVQMGIPFRAAKAAAGSGAELSITNYSSTIRSLNPAIRVK